MKQLDNMQENMAALLAMEDRSKETVGKQD
jgi:hypothetical protein